MRATVNLNDAAHGGWFSFFNAKIVNHQPHDELTAKGAAYPLAPEQDLRFEIGAPGQLRQIGNVKPNRP